MIHQAKDLSPDQLSTLEALLGKAVSQQDQISVRVLPVTPAVSMERRREVIAAMQEYFARIDARPVTHSEEETDAIINEALRSTRPNYVPVS